MTRLGKDFRLGIVARRVLIEFCGFFAGSNGAQQFKSRKLGQNARCSMGQGRYRL